VNICKSPEGNIQAYIKIPNPVPTVAIAAMIHAATQSPILQRNDIVLGVSVLMIADKIEPPQINVNRQSRTSIENFSFFPFPFCFTLSG
jgi:hypothetical protein